MEARDQFVTRNECDGCKGAIARELGESHDHIDAMGERVAALDSLVRGSVVDRLSELAVELRNGLASVRGALEHERERAIVALERRVSDYRELGHAGHARRVALWWKIAIGLVLAAGGAGTEIALRHFFGG